MKIDLNAKELTALMHLTLLGHATKDAEALHQKLRAHLWFAEDEAKAITERRANHMTNAYAMQPQAIKPVAEFPPDSHRSRAE